MMTVDQRRTGRGRQQGQSTGAGVRGLRATRHDRTIERAVRPAGGDLLVRLHLAAAVVRHHVEQAVLRPAGLSWTAFIVLRQASVRKDVETRVVAAETGIAKGTLTGVVDALVERGLLRRRGHPKDGRLVLLEATRAGRALVGRIMPAVQAEEALLLHGVSGKQLDQLGGVLLQLVQHVDSVEGRARRR
jgi:MarR family transcriptional regulator, organic hydroperoxide resistance regulator